MTAHHPEPAFGTSALRHPATGSASIGQLPHFWACVHRDRQTYLQRFSATHLSGDMKTEVRGLPPPLPFSGLNAEARAIRGTTMAQFDLSHTMMFITGVAIPSGGFLIKRLLTGARAQERVTLYAGLTDIAAKMKQHGVSAGDVTTVEAFISRKRREGVLITQTADETPATEDDKRPAGYWSQASMNQRAGASFQTATAQLEEVLLELEHYVSEEHLRAVQETWERFRDEQADFAASQYEGGSIAPLIRASEAEAITQQRLAWARAELADRQDR